MARLVNHTYDEIEIGQGATLSRHITEEDIRLFAAVSGDANPLHLDGAFAAATPYGEPIAQGMLSAALISAAIGMQLPGPGSVYQSQALRFLRPVKIGDSLEVRLKVTGKDDARHLVTLDCRVINQLGKLVTRGPAEVIAPREKLSLPAPAVPRATLHPPQ